jgi:SAM-dependent methyltransferase
MAACTECNLCDRPDLLAEAADRGLVPCNVRRFKDEHFTFWRCAGCGSLHCAEDADLPHYYADYPLKQQTVTFHERIGYRNRLRLLERQGLQQSDRILDYGCGAGLFVDFLRARGFDHVFGYDPYLPAVADPQLLTETYDAVVSYDVIEHDDDPRQWLRTVGRLVRPDGLLAIGTPNADGVSIARKNDPSLHPPYHRHILSERMLLALGRAEGLELVHVQRRSSYDSFYPTVNSRFMWRYIQKSGGCLDAVNEPPRTGLVLRSPELLFLAFFGYLLPLGDNLLVTFRNTRQPVRAEVAVACCASRSKG